MLYDDEFEEFRPNDYYELAEELYNNIDKFSCEKNALLRCIISRAYYASFLQIRQALINKGYEDRFNGRGEHETLHKILEKDKPLSTFFNDDIKDKNYDLKKNRIPCDYHFKCPDRNNKWSNQDIDVLLEYSKSVVKIVKAEF